MFGRGRARRRAQLTPQVVAIVRGMLEQKGMAVDFELSDPLSTAGIGLDSMDILELLRAVESECGVKIPDRHWGTTPPGTIDDILDIIAR